MTGSTTFSSEWESLCGGNDVLPAILGLTNCGHSSGRLAEKCGQKKRENGIFKYFCPYFSASHMSRRPAEKCGQKKRENGIFKYFCPYFSASCFFQCFYCLRKLCAMRLKTARYFSCSSRGVNPCIIK